MQNYIWIATDSRRDAHPGTSRKLADHSVGQRDLSVVSLSARGKHRHRKRARVRGQMGSRANRVIPQPDTTPSAIATANPINPRIMLALL